jgi:hypothetical protein
MTVPPSSCLLSGLPHALDIEASGFGHGSYPIEIGVALSDGTRLCYLVRPEAGWDHWDDAAEGIHGIPRDVLLRRGRPVAEIASLLNSRLRDDTIYSDAWGNDLSWLGRLYDAADQQMSYKLESVISLLAHDEQDCWTATRQRVFERLGETRHRASTNALVIQLTYGVLQGANLNATIAGVFEDRQHFDRRITI